MADSTKTLEAKHRANPPTFLGGPQFCRDCQHLWPCDTAVMHSALDSAERDLEATNRQLEALTTEAAWALARVKALESGLQTIENLVNAPQWDTARRYRVGEIARATLDGK